MSCTYGVVAEGVNDLDGVVAEGVNDLDGVAVGVVEFVWFVGVFGIPHISDSVELTNLSLGLLGAHMAAFCSGVNCCAWLILEDSTIVIVIITIAIAAKVYASLIIMTLSLTLFNFFTLYITNTTYLSIYG